MTSRHTQRNAQGELVTFSDQELARLERTNHQQSGPNNAIMGDYGNQEQLTCSVATDATTDASNAAEHPSSAGCC
ncbi:hypothetical protein DY000_02014042 [Brassica cretica]|nr:hypothetical protein DY000_02014042 [Brassica cretica]